MPRSRPITLKTTGALSRATWGDVDLPAPCVALLPDSEPCGREPIGDGSPVDLCPDHALALFRHMQTLLRDAPFVDIPAEVNATRMGRGASTRIVPCSDAENMNGWPSVVYYMATDEHIKIGTTTNMRRRFGEYPPCVRLLAVEPGGRAVEKQRHDEFAGQRVSAKREWFERSAGLEAHVRRIAAAGLPPGPLTTGITPPAHLTA